MSEIASFDTQFESDTSPQIQLAFPKVVAALTTYNGGETVLETVASLTKLRYPHLELVVIDNGSTDGSAETIAKRFPEVEVVRRERNEGIVPGLNLGLRRAIEAECAYVLLLNNDLEADPAMVAEMVDVAESSPLIACVGPKALRLDERDRIWSAGGSLRFRESVIVERGRGERDVGQFDGTADVDYLNGSALLIRRAALERIGQFDSIYFVGAGDADWCMRARRLGYRCCYAPRARVWQWVAPAAEPSVGQAYHAARGSVIFARRYADWRDWTGYWASLLARLPIDFARQLAQGNERIVVARWRGVVSGLRAPVSVPPAAW